jgi:hypothetical protein
MLRRGGLRKGFVLVSYKGAARTGGPSSLAMRPTPSVPVGMCRLVPLSAGWVLVLRKALSRKTLPAQSMTFSGRIASLDRFRSVSELDTGSAVAVLWRDKCAYAQKLWRDKPGGRMPALNGRRDARHYETCRVSSPTVACDEGEFKTPDWDRCRNRRSDRSKLRGVHR